MFKNKQWLSEKKQPVSCIYPNSFPKSKKAAGGLHSSEQTAPYENALLCPDVSGQFPKK